MIETKLCSGIRHRHGRDVNAPVGNVVVHFGSGSPPHRSCRVRMRPDAGTAEFIRNRGCLYTPGEIGVAGRNADNMLIGAISFSCLPTSEVPNTRQWQRLTGADQRLPGPGRLASRSKPLTSRSLNDS
jgi:hypothetical protein